MNKKIFIILLEILAIILFVMFLVPFVLLIMNAAKTSNEFNTGGALKMPENFAILFENIKYVLTNNSINLAGSFVSSFIITAVSLFFGTIFAAMAAWALIRRKTRGSHLIFLLFIAALVIPFQIVMYPLITVYRGIFDIFGIQLRGTYIGVIFAYIGFMAPMTIFLFHGFMKSIPLELEEAATIDGCNKVQIFFLIVFPILKPIYVTTLLLNGIWIWNDYLLPLLILGNGSDSPKTIPLTLGKFTGSYVTEWNYLLTSVMLAMVPVIILFIFAQKFIIKGMVEGAVK